MRALPSAIAVVALYAAGTSGCSSHDRSGADGGPGADGGGLTASCPADPPTGGSACARDGLSCTWARCTADGVSRAACSGGTWTVDATPCTGMFACNEGGISCTDDQLCEVRSGGALLVDCATNPCGENAIEVACACGFCGGPENCTVSDRTATCNTCPSGLCP